MSEFFDECLKRNINLGMLCDFYILHTMKRIATKMGSARILGLTLNGLKKRMTKIDEERLDDQTSLNN
jgi:hypothetical protein